MIADVLITDVRMMRMYDSYKTSPQKKQKETKSKCKLTHTAFAKAQRSKTHRII